MQNLSTQNLGTRLGTLEEWHRQISISAIKLVTIYYLGSTISSFTNIYEVLLLGAMGDMGAMGAMGATQCHGCHAGAMGAMGAMRVPWVPYRCHVTA